MCLPLYELLDRAAERFPQHAAIEESGAGIATYAQLKRLSDRLRDRLVSLGVMPGDRVGICMRKSADGVAAMFGIMKAGAAYVPVDPSAPAVRSAYIFQDCGVSAVFVEDQLVDKLRAGFSANDFHPRVIVINGVGAGESLQQALDEFDSKDRAPQTPSVEVGPFQLAYILYTSGSTGRPKGVMISHGNARSFVDWCSDVFQPSELDRFSSHAPFHFDLSIFDIYVSLKHGATMVVVDEQLAKDAARLAEWISRKQITVWYSAPSILSMMAQFGKLAQYDYSTLQKVLFAGEVFPIKYLQLLKSLIPHPRYFNLYGPTETNVCTWCEVPRTIPESQTDPVSIGVRCSHCRAMVVAGDGSEVARGSEGELCIAGPSVLQGYWNMPQQTIDAFFHVGGERWYRTGDIVIEEYDGSFRFLGRRDRMVKKRGNRIELGEIETALYRHPSVKEAAVIATANADGEVQIKAFVSTRDGKQLSIIEAKRHCAEHIPLYMVPDIFRWLETLPKTSTDKLDFQRLKELF